MNHNHTTTPSTLPGSSNAAADLIVDITSSDLGSTAVATVENSVLTDELQVIVWLDPISIVSSSLPNRDETAFDSDNFYALKQSILQAGGNIQPVKVCRIGVADFFEVVFGHRRIHACRQLGIKVRAVVVNNLDNREILLERVRENIGRSDLSALDFGYICARALADNLFVSRKQMAIEFGKDEGDVSRALSLASLPVEVIAAFESPSDIQYRHAKPLKDALANNHKDVIAAARDVAAQGGKRLPALVLDRLIRPRNEEIGRSNLASRATLLWDGKPYAELKTQSDGKVSISFERRLDEADRDQLLANLEAFMKRQVATRSRATQRRNAQQAAKAEV
jgi:ParB family transcriptional regulator, chromosome partitioning protein